jgi:predicted DNA-binding protein
MAKKVAKKRMGRPVTTGIRPSWAIRFPREVADAIERFAKKEGISRSDAIRKIVEIGLRALDGNKI